MEIGKKEKSVLGFLYDKAERIYQNDVFYIERQDKDGNHIEFMPECYCKDCIDGAIEELERNDKNKEFQYIKCMESSPEYCYFITCRKCGKQLDHSIVGSCAINGVIEDVSKCKSLKEIDEGMAYRIVSIIDSGYFITEKKLDLMKLLNKLWEKHLKK